MEVFVAGGTGVVGRRAVPAILEAGHTATVVSRSAEKDELVRSLGAQPIRVDLLDRASVMSAVSGFDAVVNLATHIPPLNKATRRKAWQINDQIRSVAAPNLADSAAANGVGRFVQESITFPYADQLDNWIDEDDARIHSWATETSDVAENAGLRFADTGGVGVVLRFAQFYAWDSQHVQAMTSFAERGVTVAAGPDDAYQPWISAEDAGSAVVAALQAPTGVYNIVDDEPLRRREVRAIMAMAVERTSLRSVPPVAMRMIGGKAAELLMRSQRVSNRRFRDTTGWAPEHPSLREGWPAMMERSRR